MVQEQEQEQEQKQEQEQGMGNIKDQLEKKCQKVFKSIKKSCTTKVKSRN